MNAPAHRLNGSLARQQAALLNALFPAKGQSGAASEALHDHLVATDTQARRGLQAYQANGHLLAERSLRAAYPVIEQMLGSDSFNALARDLWHQHPPALGDMARWGDALPDFLAASPQLADVPYLADVARAEWSLHRAATATDRAPDPASFARLTTQDPDTLALTFAPGTHLVTSRFPVASLVLAHLEENADLSEAAQRLQSGVAETALIWREGFRPRLVICEPAAARLVQSLLDGHNLSLALDSALNGPPVDAVPFDFSLWLTEAVTHGRVIGVHDAPLSTP